MKGPEDKRIFTSEEKKKLRRKLKIAFFLAALPVNLIMKKTKKIHERKEDFYMNIKVKVKNAALIGTSWALFASSGLASLF